MRFPAWLLGVSLALAPAFVPAFIPPAFGQFQSQLPDLGDNGASELPPQAERRIGETVMRDIRRDPAYLDDPDIAEYLNGLAARLVEGAPPGARQDFELFALKDSTINAFALPGGYIGVHTGLIIASDNESEIASVLAHEMAHVTQRHIARQIGIQKQMTMPMMIATAAAILFARSRPDLAGGAAMAVQGAAVQGQLAFSRDFEREADRIGFQTLIGSGFDVRAMAAFFEKLQRYTRVYDDGKTPSYLRSHPVTSERIADAEARAAAQPYRQHADVIEYHLVRAKVRAEALDPQDAVRMFGDAVKDRRFANEPGARYGLAIALMRAKDPKGAEAEVARLRAMKVASPMIDTLEARAKVAQGDPAGALAVLKASRARYPSSHAVLYAMIDVLQSTNHPDEVLSALAEPLRFYPSDVRLQEARARAYAAQGKRLLQHQAQAEVYVLRGSLPAAIEQLQMAQTSGDGNFYDLSVVDARLKELRAQHAREMADEKKNR